MKVQVLGVGLLGPGLPDWAQGAALLRRLSSGAGVGSGADAESEATAAALSSPTVVPAPQRLPATERRRAGTVVKASIVAADQAVAAAGLDAAQLPTVFTSSTGDPTNCHLLCEALAQPERLVSPTRFTNSVHNAAAGYWHIALQSRAPSTSLAAFDASFCAGLLEAAVQCLATQAPVLLVACDVPYPEPLHSLRPVADVFAVALVLAPAMPGAVGPVLELQLQGGMSDGAGSSAVQGTSASAGNSATDRSTDSAACTPCSSATLEALRQSIPAARALPLLQALAQGSPARVVLQGAPGQSLAVHVQG